MKSSSNPDLTKQFVGRSAAFESIKQTIEAVAAWDSSVIITGETGTGKEIVARMIHSTSDRYDQIFVPLDCTTLTGQLFESQLFGHVKGAFTSAHSDALGFFRAADGGTIFLDEIGELSLELQPKLLRVLQEGRVTPVGSTKSYKIDVRVICATNRNLRKMVSDGKFRDDLYYRLNVMTVKIPPLRERKEDIAVLAQHFLDRQAELYDGPAKKLTPQALAQLTEYPFPGNIRELSNLMERAYILSKSDQISTSILPAEIKNDQKQQKNSSQNHVRPLDELQKQAVIQALNASRGRKMAAARMLNIDHRKFGRLVEKYNLKPVYKSAAG